MNEQTFEIYRDGELQTPSITEHAMAITARAGQALLHKLGNVATELITPVILEYEDAQNHTHLRDQYFADKRARAAASIASRFQLV